MKNSFSIRYFSFFLSGFILLSLVIVYFIHSPFQEFVQETFEVMMSGNKEETHAYFKEFGLWGPIAIILFIILQMFLIVFPSWLPIIIAVMAYGFWWGIVISLTGITIASTIGYYIGIRLKGAILNKMIGEKKLQKMDFWISNYSFVSVILFRISPFLSNDAISFIAGMLQMDYKKFMTATLTGMVPLSVAIAYFAEDTSTLKDGLYWIGGGGVIAYGVYILIDYNKRKKQK